MMRKFVRRHISATPKPSHQTTPDEAQPHQTNDMLHLQRTIGNQAVLRKIEAGELKAVQRDFADFGNITGPKKPPSPVPSLADLNRWDQQRAAPVRKWLADHHTTLTLSTSIFNVMGQIRRDVPEARDIGNNELQHIVRSYATQQRIQIPEPKQQGAKTKTTDISNAASSGLSINGTAKVGGKDGKLTVSLSGATASLSSGTEKVSTSVGPGGASIKGESGKTSGGVAVNWEGQVTYSLGHNDFNFEASLSPTAWQIQLTFGENVMPDLTKLGEIFRQGESALRGAIGGIAGANNASDVQSAISNNAGGIKEAVSTATAIQSAGKISGRLQISGPMSNNPTTGQPDNTQPAGVTISVFLSVSF